MNRMQGDHASPVPPGEQDAGLTVLGKTCEFFQICDLEGKGFITCQDMQVKQNWLCEMQNKRSSQCLCENDVKQLRLQLRKGGSRLLSSFEEFLVRTFSRLQEADNEKNKLECALEKLEQQCAELLSSKEEIKVENTKPKRTNQELQRDLERKSHKLSQAQKQWQVLQEEASRLHEEKEICGLVGSLIVIDSLPLIDLCAGACENSLVNYLTIVSVFQDYSLIFRERSAYSGYNTKKSVLHFARFLKEHEDKVKEKTTKLQAGMNKKSCCIRP